MLSQSSGSGSSGSAAAGDGAGMATWGGQIKALIRDAIKLAEQCKADTAQAFVEGMAQGIGGRGNDAALH